MSKTKPIGKRQKVTDEHSLRCVTCSKEATSRQEEQLLKFEHCVLCKSSVCGECSYSVDDTVSCTKCVSTIHDLKESIDNIGPYD